VLGLVGGAPGGETPRVADSSAAGAGRFFHNSVTPSKQNDSWRDVRVLVCFRTLGYYSFSQLLARRVTNTSAHRSSHAVEVLFAHSHSAPCNRASSGPRTDRCAKHSAPCS
jgi:hypothetical protein